MFSTILRNLRKSKGLSQEKLAKAIFISSSAISQYENGTSRPGRETLEAIATFFNVSTDYLLGKSPVPDLEEQMNQVYHGNITVSELLKMCMNLDDNHRRTLLDVVRALNAHGESQEE